MAIMEDKEINDRAAEETKDSEDKVPQAQAIL